MLFTTLRNTAPNRQPDVYTHFLEFKDIEYHNAYLFLSYYLKMHVTNNAELFKQVIQSMITALTNYPLISTNIITPYEANKSIQLLQDIL